MLFKFWKPLLTAVVLDIVLCDDHWLQHDGGDVYLAMADFRICVGLFAFGQVNRFLCCCFLDQLAVLLE